VRADLALTGRATTESGRVPADATGELLPWPNPLRSTPPPATPPRRVPLDAAGAFQLTVPAPGSWRIVVRAPGFFPMAYDLVAAASIDLPRVTLQPAGALTVRVLDPEGHPLPNALVQAEASPGAREGWTPAPQEAISDVQGTAAGLVAAGPLRLHVAAPGFAAAALSAGPSAEPVTVRLLSGTPLLLRVLTPAGRPAPGVAASLDGMAAGHTDPQGQLTVLLSPERGAALRLLDTGAAAAWGEATLRGGAPEATITLSPPRRLSGRAVEPRAGQAVAGALVWTADDLGALTRSDAAGRWHLAVPFVASLQRLRAVGPGGPLVIEPAARLAGRVADEAGAAVAGAAILLNRDGAHAFPVTNTDAAGRFAVEDLEPRALQLTVLAAGFLREPLPLTLSAEGEEDLEITLRSGANLEGEVTTPDGEPAAGARVSLLYETGDPPSAELDVSQTTADPEGHYRLQGLVAGAHTVKAELSGFVGARQQVAVHPGDNQVDLTLTQGVAVAGQVETAAGDPAFRAELFLEPAGDSAISPPLAVPPAVSGTDGAFRWTAIADGHYRLRALMPGWSSSPLAVEVSGKPVTGLRVRLDPGGTISGRLLGVDPAELRKVEVRATGADGRDRLGSVAADGSYRIEGLPPGDSAVAADLPGTQGMIRTARRHTVLPAAGETVFLDLELGAGHGRP
jgi:hypothetical protein